MPGWLWLVCGVLLVSGREDRAVLPAVDPYTEGEPSALQKAGYVSYGPFPWGDGHDTTEIEEVLGFSLLWVETEHFRIGSSLPEYKVPGDRLEKQKLREELGRLKKRLPRVDATPRRLDPWLRVHLFADRLEALYDEFCERFGVSDDTFPKAAPQSGAAVESELFMGVGPYLGQRAKFTVLLVEKPSTLGRYSSHFLGRAETDSVRENFAETGSLLFAASLDSIGSQKTDSALHSRVVYSTTGNLLDGFRSFQHNAPFWWSEGLGQWFCRRIDPRWSIYAVRRERESEHWKWEPKIRARVRHEYFPSSAEMLSWPSYDGLDPAAHMIMWSRVDYLMSLEGDGLGKFMAVLKEPLPPKSTQSREEFLLAQQHRALQEAWGISPEQLDAAWAKYVLKTYSRR